MAKKKFSKPLMERRRRARINESLNELKSLVLSSMNKDHTKFNKMEKADVLELTVNYLKTLEVKEKPRNEIEQQRNFIAGYNECAREVQHYLLRSAEVSPQVKARMLTHISATPQEINTAPLSCPSKEASLPTKPSYSQVTSLYPSPPASPITNTNTARFVNASTNSTSLQKSPSSENRASNFQDYDKKQPLSEKSIWRPWVSV